MAYLSCTSCRLLLTKVWGGLEQLAEIQCEAVFRGGFLNVGLIMVDLSGYECYFVSEVRNIDF